MSYGYAIYDDQGRDITGLITPIFILGKYTQESGTVTYPNQPPGKTLKAAFVGVQSWKGTMPGAPTISISGNTVSWHSLKGSDSSYIYTFWG